MIIDISDVTFKRIMNDKKLSLPIRWDELIFQKHYQIYLNTTKIN